MSAAALTRKWQQQDLGEARRYSRSVLKNLVEDAEAAGFNPLTVLRAGGGAGYNAAAGFAPLSRTAPVMEATTGAMGRIGQSMETIGNNMVANYDPYAGDKRALERQLVMAQIDNLNASTGSLRSQSFKVPSYSAGQKERRASGASGWLSKGAAAKIGQSIGYPTTKPEINGTTVTNPAPPGSPWQRAPWNVDASAWEDAYGEPGDWLGGAVNAAGDALWNFKRATAWATEKAKEFYSDSGTKVYRAPPDLYDMKMYIPPAVHGGPSYQ